MSLTPEEARAQTRRDIDCTRYYPTSLTNTVRYEPAFKTWAAERVIGESPSWISEAEPSQQARRQRRTVLKTLAGRFVVAVDLLADWVRDYIVNPEWRAALGGEQRAAFAEWERLHSHRELMRTLEAIVAVLRQTPGATREQMEVTYGTLDEEMQRALRPALDAYLMAGDLADEVRRLLAYASTAANDVYTQRRAALLEAA